MKTYLAKVWKEKFNYKLTDTGRILLLDDGDNWVDVTLMVLLGADLKNPEEALIDLYTDQDGTEGVSIQEVTE